MSARGSAAALVCDFTGELLAGRFQFALTRVGVAELVRQVQAVRAVRPVELVRVGIEAAGHYHRPLTSAGCCQPTGSWWSATQPTSPPSGEPTGSVGSRTDAVDLAAISDLLVAGRGVPLGRTDAVLVELAGLVAHRARRVQVRSALKNQLLGQLDRCFPGLGGCLADLLGAKVGRLLAAEFADPARLARMGPARFCGFAARRGVIVQRNLAERLVATARVALATDEAAVARQILADDLQLLADLDGQIGAVERRLAGLVAATPFAVLGSVPGWATLRVAAYAAAVGEPARWPSARQVYRAAGLTPTLYASAGRRRDGAISREGSVALRRALWDLGVGLWHCDPPSRAYASRLRARGKPGGVIATALANRAGRIAFAMVRDQAIYDPHLWR